MTRRHSDALTLACQAWQIMPRTEQGIMTIRLTAWYNRLVADPIGFEAINEC